MDHLVRVSIGVDVGGARQSGAGTRVLGRSWLDFLAPTGTTDQGPTSPLLWPLIYAATKPQHAVLSTW